MDDLDQRRVFGNLSPSSPLCFIIIIILVCPPALLVESRAYSEGGEIHADMAVNFFVFVCTMYDFEKKKNGGKTHNFSKP